MVDSEDFKNCKAVIYDQKSGEKLAETMILDYNKSTHVVTVSASAFSFHDSMRVTLLIQGQSVVDCMGIVRRQSVANIREITLYRFQVRESRGAARYNVNTTAVIDTIIEENRDVPLAAPVTVAIENISASGVLVSVTEPSIDIGTEFWMCLNIAGSETVIRAEAVRVVGEEDGKRRLGCSFVELRK